MAAGSYSRPYWLVKGVWGHCSVETMGWWKLLQNRTEQAETTLSTNMLRRCSCMEPVKHMKGIVGLNPVYLPQKYCRNRKKKGTPMTVIFINPSFDRHCWKIAGFVFDVLNRIPLFYIFPYALLKSSRNNFLNIVLPAVLGHSLTIALTFPRGWGAYIPCPWWLLPSAAFCS